MERGVIGNSFYGCYRPREANLRIDFITLMKGNCRTAAQPGMTLMETHMERCTGS